MLLHAESFQLCPTLCNPMNSSPLGSSVHGIIQARILGWVAMPSSWGSSKIGIEATSHVCSIAGVFFTMECFRWYVYSFGCFQGQDWGLPWWLSNKEFAFYAGDTGDSCNF